MNKVSSATRSWLILVLVALAALSIVTFAVMTAPGPTF